MNIKRIVPNSIKEQIKKIIYGDITKNNWPINRLEKQIRVDYQNHMGRELDLKNPKLFTEKIQWMKLYYNNPNLSRCVDKCEFKKYISEKLGEGYTARLIKEWESPNEVSFDGLPEKFVVKSNCQSNGRYIVVVKNKETIDLQQLKDKIQKEWFEPKNLLINSFCRAYYSVKPKVYVEEYLEEFVGCLNDYKVFCFNGKPEFFYVATEQFEDGVNTDIYPISFYSLNWEKMNVTYGPHPSHKNMEKPYHFDEMLNLSSVLAKDFPFVRVDFFDTKDKLYLAELTFYPGGGFTNYSPLSFDSYMGGLLDLPIN